MTFFPRLLLIGLLSVCAALAAADAAPPEAVPAPPAPTIEPVPPAAMPPRAPVGGEQEGPYYSTARGRTGLLFDVSRSLDGEFLNRSGGEVRFEFARDLHRGDGGQGHWLGLRGAWRYREVSLLGRFDDRWFGSAAATRAQSAHLLYGGVVSQGHAQPFSEGGFGLCAWWPAGPRGDGRVRVLPEIGFRATVWRWPTHRASLSDFRRGEPQDNGLFYLQLDLFGAGAWNFRHKDGWIYDGGARCAVGVGAFQATVGYRLYGLRSAFAQGPELTAAMYF